MRLVMPTVSDMMKSGYHIESYEALHRIIECLVCKDSYNLKIEDIVAVDKIVKMMGLKEYSLWTLRKIRSMLEFRDLAEIGLKQDRIRVVDRNSVHVKYKQMKPEEILRLAIEDNDISGYLVKTYTEINNELGVAKFNIHLIDSAYALMQYCGIVDDINESRLQVHTAILMHSLKQNGYNRIEIFKKAIEYVINKLED